jgi:hypothetical protein
MPPTENQLKMEADIKQMFDELANKRDPKTKTRIYSHEYCLAQVADKFYKKPKTVEKIVNGWGRYNRK